MNLEPTQIMVNFWLGGDYVDFDALTSTIGINPTEIRKKESYKIKEYAKDSWTLSTGYKESMAVSSPFEELVNMLNRKEDAINRLIEEYSLECIFVVVIKAEENKGPEVVLTSKCVNFASKVNAEIHFDLYYY